MENPSYVASQIAGRVRLRHPILGTEEGLEKACAVLRKHKRVLEIRPGTSSLLCIYEPSLKLNVIYKELEAELPDLLTDKKTPVPGISGRKLESRALLAALGFCSLMGFIGSSRAHIWSAVVFLGLTAHHVWERRRAL